MGSLVAKNKALMGKWWWRFKVEEGALWVKVIKSIHGKEEGFSRSRKHFSSATWGGILKIGSDLERIRFIFGVREKN